MDNFKKLLSLFVALAMVFTFAMPIFAQDTEAQAGESEQEHNITLKLSDEIQLVKASDFKVVSNDNPANEITKAKAGTEINILYNNELCAERYIVYFNGEQKTANDYDYKNNCFKFTMPNEDVLIEVTPERGFSANCLRAEEASVKPEGWVTVTLKTDEHSRFNHYGKDKKIVSSTDTDVYYVKPNVKVSLVYGSLMVYNNVRLEPDKFYHISKDSYIKNEVFTEDTVKELKYEKYKGYNVTLHKYAPDGQKGETVTKYFEPDTIYEDALKFLRANETGSVHGKKFVGWAEKQKNYKDEEYLFIRAINKKYDSDRLIHPMYFNDPTMRHIFEDGDDSRAIYEDLDLYELYTTDNVVYYGLKTFIKDGNRKLDAIFIDDFATMPDGYIAGLDNDKDYYEFNFATGEYSSVKFDNDANPISRDYFLGYDYKPRKEEEKNRLNFETRIFDIISYPKLDYSKEENPTIDLSKMVVGIFKYDEQSNKSSVEVVPYQEFESKGISVNYKQGQKLTGKDDEKRFRVAYKDGNKEYFLYVYPKLCVPDETFDPNTVTEIEMNSWPVLEYEYSDSDMPLFNPARFEVGFKIDDNEDPDGYRYNIVPYYNFYKYGLNIKIEDGPDVNADTVMKPEYNGKKIIVYFAKKPELKAETKQVLNIVDKDAALREAKTKAKEEINGLANLSQAEIEKANKAVDAAKDKAGIDKALEEAKKLSKANTEKKAAEEKLVKDKEALNKKIEDANLKDQEATKKLQEKVNAATIDTDIDALTKEIEAAIQKEKDKEEFEDRKSELKKEINESDLDDQVKKDLTEKVDALKDPSKLNDIRQEFTNAKELEDAKAKAKEEVKELENLDNDEKLAYDAEIERAVDKAGVEKVLSDAKSKDKSNKEKKEVEAAKEEAEKAQEEADEKAKEAEKKAAELKKAEEDAKEAEEAAEKAKSTEEKAQKAFEDAKAKEEEAQKALEKDPENEELKQAVEDAKKAANVAEDAQKKAKTDYDEKAEKAEEAKTNVENAKKAAEDAKNEADAAKKNADEKTKEAEEKENALVPTAEEKNSAKKIIENLPNLSSSEKNIYKNKVDQATTKKELEEAVNAAREKDAENKNKIKPEPQPGPYIPEPYEPYEPSNPGGRYEPAPKYEPKQQPKAEPKKEVKKEDKKVEEKVQPVHEVKPITVMAPTLPVELTDIPATEAGEAIKNMVARGVLKGTGADKFEPETTITRSMVTEVFMRIATEKTIDTAQEFKDVKQEDWYNNSVKWAASKNIIKGFEDGTFKPNQKVTAQEFAVMLKRMLDTYKIEMPNQKAIDEGKYQALQDWSKEAVIKMIEKGLIKETDAPIETREITRAELAKALDMIIKFVEQQ